MISYCVYDESGAILEVRTEAYDILPCSEDISDDTHYVDVESVPHVIRKRSAINTDHQVDGFQVTFSHLPEGIRVNIENAETVTDSTPLSVDFDAPGTYLVTFSNEPKFIATEVEVSIG